MLKGRIPACKWVRLACERNKRDFKRERTKAFPYRFDEAAAHAICASAEQFPHIKGPKAKVIGRDDEGRPIWNPIELEPWQCWNLTTLFGWQQLEKDLRRFRVGLILVPRKNAKSTIAAVILLYMLGPDRELGAEVVSYATTRPQAAIVAGMAYEMAFRTPSYREFFGVRMGARTSRRLEIPDVASVLEPLSADAQTLDGLNIHCGVVDEVHAHRTRDGWDVLDTATGARDQPLLLPISTAGTNTAGICYELVTYLQKILDGVIQDESFFGIYYTIDPEDREHFDDPKVQRKANPNYGISVSPEDLARKAARAKVSQAALNNYLTKHLNVFVKGGATWMPMDRFQACGNPKLRLEDYAQFPCWIGVDLNEVRDIAALIALIRTSPGKYVAFGRFYLPEDTIEGSPIAAYSGWVHEGHLISTDGNTADFFRIQDDLIKWTELLNVQAICFDRALAAMMMQSLTQKLGGSPEVLVVNQNTETMNPAMQTMLKLVLAGNFTHDGNPAYAWQFSNVEVVPNYKEEIYPRKAGGKDSPNKIDGAVATLTALSVAEAEDGIGADAYDDDGVFTV